MPLIFVKPLENCVITKIRGQDKDLKHLRSLGLIERTPVRLLQSCRRNMIIEIRSSRLALDSRLAKRIEVELTD